MKEQYELAEIELIRFKAKDILTISGDIDHEDRDGDEGDYE